MDGPDLKCLQPWICFVQKWTSLELASDFGIFHNFKLVIVIVTFPHLLSFFIILKPKYFTSFFYFLKRSQRYLDFVTIIQIQI